MYRLGDMVRIGRRAVLAPLTREELDRQFAEALFAQVTGIIPPWAVEEYDDIVLTTKEMVDHYNALHFQPKQEKPHVE